MNQQNFETAQQNKQVEQVGTPVLPASGPDKLADLERTIEMYLPFLEVLRTGGTTASGRMYLSAGQTLSSGSPVALDTVSFASGLTADTANHKFIVQSSGTYFIVGIVTYASPQAAKQAIANIAVNGSTKSTVSAHTAGTNTVGVMVSDVLQLNSGDQITLVGQFNFTSGTLTSGSTSNYLSILKL